MISISEALEIIEREAVSSSAETVDLSESVGRVLAADVSSDSDLPPFDRSQMDGFAVRAGDVETANEANPARLEIVGESVAGNGFDGEIGAGEAVRIMTGARVPCGADAVQKKESAREIAGGESGDNKNTKSFVDIFERVKPRENYVARGAEIGKGEKVFGAGEIITAQMIAALAAFGLARVRVFEKPRVSILATGSEIVGVAETPRRDQIRDSNSISLQIFARQAGANVEVLPLVKDDVESLKAQIAEAVGLNSKTKNQKPKTKDQSKIQNPKSKILILSGGVSVGDYDFTKPALRDLGAQIFFERVALRPGKPTVFARLNDALIFGLPGNPVSVAVTFLLFVRAALLKMQGARDCELRGGFAVLAQRVKGASERDSFLPAQVAANEKGKLVVESLRFGGSSNFVRFARANCLIFVPRNEILKAGAVVKILFLP